jgi:hypothetical protein
LETYHLARLDLGVFVDDLPIATVEVGFDGRALRLQAKARLALPAGGNPINATNLPVLEIMIASLRFVS